jgi:hypothetical protein
MFCGAVFRARNDLLSCSELSCDEMYDVVLMLCLILAAALSGFILQTTCARLRFQIYPSGQHTVQAEGRLSRKTFAYGVVSRQPSLGHCLPLKEACIAGTLR